jgi:hypothetical protein
MFITPIFRKTLHLKIMGLFRAGREERLCAFCGAEHRVYMKSHISFLDVILCVLAGLLAVAPFTDGLDPRGIAIGAVFIGVSEVFVGLRHRLSLKCGRCGFDPIIYRKSQEQAARLVREHIARRSMNPSSLLAEPVVAAGLKAARDRAKTTENTRSRPFDSTQQP